MTFHQWKLAAQALADKLGLPPDLWALDDPYDLKIVAEAAFRARTTPATFITNTFEEDLARIAGDKQDVADATREENPNG
jgi:hypothetical protein